MDRSIFLFPLPPALAGMKKAVSMGRLSMIGKARIPRGVSVERGDLGHLAGEGMAAVFDRAIGPRCSFELSPPERATFNPDVVAVSSLPCVWRSAPVGFSALAPKPKHCVDGHQKQTTSSRLVIHLSSARECDVSSSIGVQSTMEATATSKSQVPLRTKSVSPSHRSASTTKARHFPSGSMCR